MTYSCKNRAPFPSLIASPSVYPISVSGHILDAKAQELRQFPFTRDCQYTLTWLGRFDKGCFQCKWRIYVLRED
jgi:hypothetical protein